MKMLYLRLSYIAKLIIFYDWVIMILCYDIYWWYYVMIFIDDNVDIDE